MLPVIAAAALSVTSPALTVPEAREAVRAVESRAVSKGHIDRFHIGVCRRRAPRRVRCHVSETLRFEDADLYMDGWTGIWLRDGKTVIRYPRQGKRG